MTQNWATEHLQAIRTLMERSAIYRRALAPITLLVGSIGAVAAAIGWLVGIESHRGFGLYWIAVCLVALAGAFLLVRRQALKDAEPFWSSPTRRVAQALLPPFLVGLVACVLLALPRWREPLQIWWLPPIWIVLSGCAILALLNQRSYASGMPAIVNAHWLMGATFGGFHLAYGAYLHFTEKRKNEA